MAFSTSRFIDNPFRDRGVLFKYINKALINILYDDVLGFYTKRYITDKYVHSDFIEVSLLTNDFIYIKKLLRKARNKYGVSKLFFALLMLSKEVDKIENKLDEYGVREEYYSNNDIVNPKLTEFVNRYCNLIKRHEENELKNNLMQLSLEHFNDTFLDKKTQIEQLDLMIKDTEDRIKFDIKGVQVLKGFDDNIFSSEIFRLELNDKKQFLFDVYQSLNGNNLKGNKFPQVFNSELAFKLFKRLHNDYKDEKNRLVNYSFIYRKMYEDELINPNLRPEQFKTWLSSKPFEFEISSNQLKTMDNIGNMESKKSRYHIIKDSVKNES